ncbi:MAG: glycosyltransferase family protein [Candidatus Omnitrophica bacterium]|nr:glycosyltransferase family protein [Candidatus Omnitrophota bacterium]
MKTKAIIQARTGSTRLPRKVLLAIMGKPVLEYVIERVRRAKNIKGVIVATTDSKEDMTITDIAAKLDTEVYRGSEDDVLDRFYQAAKKFDAGHIVRITADCPLIDSAVIDSVVNLYKKSGADYCSNVLEPTFPDGEDVEVFSFNALRDAWKNAGLRSEREHVTPYMTKHPERFKLAGLRNDSDLSAKRWTLDKEKDFQFIKAVLESLYPANPAFTMKDILQFINEHPGIENINKDIPRNEGYQKSLKEDSRIK